MSDLGKDPGHGDSVAAWTTVSIVILAFATGTLAYWLDQPIFVWASLVLAIAGVAIGYLLRRAGYGVGGKHAKGH
jgi:hypothetical protein